MSRCLMWWLVQEETFASKSLLEMNMSELGFAWFKFGEEKMQVYGEKNGVVLKLSSEGNGFGLFLLV